MRFAQGTTDIFYPVGGERALFASGAAADARRVFLYFCFSMCRISNSSGKLLVGLRISRATLQRADAPSTVVITGGTAPVGAAGEAGRRCAAVSNFPPTPCPSTAREQGRRSRTAWTRGRSSTTGQCLNDSPTVLPTALGGGHQHRRSVPISASPRGVSGSYVSLHS